MARSTLAHFCRTGATKWVNLASILSRFGALSGQKRLKKGQKWGFAVTYQ
jgi:hypothetical protein